MVVAGDMNDRPGGPVRQVFAAAGFVEVQGAWPSEVVAGVPVALAVIWLRAARHESTPWRWRAVAPLPELGCSVPRVQTAAACAVAVPVLSATSMTVPASRFLRAVRASHALRPPPFD